MRIGLAAGVVAASVSSVLGGCVRSPSLAVDHTPSRYLYVWAGTGNHHSTGVDMITVLDANPASDRYGSVVAAVTVDSSGNMPHHSEFVLPKSGPLFANDYSADRSYLIDFRNPTEPRVAGRVAQVPGGRSIHSFERLPNGDVIATVQFGDGKVEGDPGRLAEFDREGKLVRSGSSQDAAFPGARIRTYGLALLPQIDRAATTSSPMDDERTANVLQIWRLSDLKLLRTLPVPAIPGDSAHMYPFELRAMSDGRTVLMNSYFCGFFTVTGIDSDPKIERVHALPLPANIGCSVPAIAGKFMIMPIAYAHRIVTLDISNPARPVEVASFATDTTFFPHWAALDNSSDRVVLTDQGDGLPRVMIARLNSATGRLEWDERFRDPGAATPGVSYDRPSWPNGVRGKATPHAALFVH